MINERLFKHYNIDTNKNLKMARTKLGAVSKDTYVDMAAYGAIAGEIKFKEK